MEYLEMRGTAKLKKNADTAVVNSVISELCATEFVDGGYMDIQLDHVLLSIEAEGTISESYSIRALIAKLQSQLSDRSMIGVTQVRWETLVVLTHWEQSTIANLVPLEQPAFAQ